MFTTGSGKTLSLAPLEYIEEVIALGKKHGVVLSHQDGHGAFEIEPRGADAELYDNWLRQASVPSPKTPPAEPVPLDLNIREAKRD